MLSPPNRIIYSLKTVAQYVEQTINFVQVQASKPRGTCPFQYDAVYLFQQHGAGDAATEDSDDDDDDDDGQDGGDDVGDAHSGGDRMSRIGNIKDGLTATKLHFHQDQWDPKEQRNYRPLNAAYEKLKDGAKNKRFPVESRFCSVLDLRKSHDDDGKKEEEDGNEEKEDGNLFVFEPEAASAKVHPNPSALNFFHNSRHSIIPNPEPSGGDDEKEADPMLNAKTLGPHILLSFHVEAADNMRCYIHINAQCTRFLPEDLKMLLPLFFEESQDNLNFVKSPELKAMIDGLDGKLRDDQFRVFLKDNKVECAYKQELHEEASKKTQK